MERFSSGTFVIQWFVRQLHVNCKYAYKCVMLLWGLFSHRVVSLQACHIYELLTIQSNFIFNIATYAYVDVLSKQSAGLSFLLI